MREKREEARDGERVRAHGEQQVWCVCVCVVCVCVCVCVCVRASARVEIESKRFVCVNVAHRRIWLPNSIDDLGLVFDESSAPLQERVLGASFCSPRPL